MFFHDNETDILTGWGAGPGQNFNNTFMNDRASGGRFISMPGTLATEEFEYSRGSGIRGRRGETLDAKPNHGLRLAGTAWEILYPGPVPVDGLGREAQ